MIVDEAGEREYVCDGDCKTPTRFASKAKAKEFVDFMKIGLDGEVQSINIVPYPRRTNR